MREPDDWRLTNQLAYFKGVELSWRRYRAFRQGWEHDHCVFCWSEFAEREDAEVLHEGYATIDEMKWVCPTCFEDFKDIFEWRVLASSKRPSP
jgi:hypothetical protein